MQEYDELSFQIREDLYLVIVDHARKVYNIWLDDKHILETPHLHDVKQFIQTARTGQIDTQLLLF